MSRQSDSPALTMLQKLAWLSDRLLRGDQTVPPPVISEPLSQPSLNFGPGHAAEARPIDVDVSTELLNRLFDRTRAQWTKLGNAEPHWSVITNDAFRQDAMTAQVEQEFYATGQGNADLLRIYEGRTQTRLQRGVCLELGCGVGRITGFLAGEFERVIAVDISPGNLSLARRRMEQIGATNVEFVQIQSVTELATLPEFDVFYSVIALQHNSPPLQQYMLKTILPKIRPGGGCLFQACTNLINYGFDALAYVDAQEEVMEVHSIPQFVVLREIRQSGLCIQEVAMDNWIGDYGSNTFFATR
ncbi:MAG: class I SAM-dependent methyltransferase [Caulobacteraceae bacterium]